MAECDTCALLLAQAARSSAGAAVSAAAAKPPAIDRVPLTAPTALPGGSLSTSSAVVPVVTTLPTAKPVPVSVATVPQATVASGTSARASQAVTPVSLPVSRKSYSVLVGFAALLALCAVVFGFGKLFKPAIADRSEASVVTTKATVPTEKASTPSPTPVEHVKPPVSSTLPPKRTTAGAPPRTADKRPPKKHTTPPVTDNPSGDDPGSGDSGSGIDHKTTVAPIDKPNGIKSPGATPTGTVTTKPKPEVDNSLPYPGYSPTQGSDSPFVGSVSEDICPDSGEIATANCPKSVTKYFRRDDINKLKKCHLHPADPLLRER